MKSSRKRQIAVLEHWFAIDNILFGKPAKQAIADKAVYEKYICTKGAFLTNLYEMYVRVKYSPETNSYKTVQEMINASSVKAQNAIKESYDIIKKKSVRKLVKEEIDASSIIEGLSENDIAKYIVAKRKNAVAIDSLVYNSVITKENKSNLTTWDGKILVDSHKTTRDALIDIAMSS